MSLILDALRRSEDDGRGQVKASLVAESGTSQRKGLSKWYIAVLFLGVILGALFVGVSLQRWEDTEHLLGSNVIAIQEGSNKINSSNNNGIYNNSEGYDAKLTGQLSAANDTVSSNSHESSLTSHQVSGVSRVLETQNDQAVALNAEMWRDAELLDAENSISPMSIDSGIDNADAKISHTGARVAKTEERMLSEADLNLAKIFERIAHEANEVSLEPHPTLLLENLSQQIKDQIPTIVYGAHGFAEEAGSTVTLNGKICRVGDTIGAVEVREILKDSVILRFRSTDFRLRALNTWINM